MLKFLKQLLKDAFNADEELIRLQMYYLELEDSQDCLSKFWNYPEYAMLHRRRYKYD